MAHALIVEEMKRKEEAEENRLLYVAMTRAQDLLILSHAEGRRRSNWQKLVDPIPVTREADRLLELRPLAPAEPAARADRFVDPPGVSGQYGSTAAATAVATFSTCPRKYLLNSIDARTGAGTGAVAAGLEAHRVLAGGSGSVEATELAARFERSELGRRAAHASRIEREFDFMVAVEDVVLRGQIDLWFEDRGELVLVDYKTDRDDSSQDAYATQLALYSIALERYAGRVPDRAVLYYLRSDRTIEVKIDRDKARSTVRLFRDAQERLDFPMRPGAQCRRCAFFENRCPAQLSATGGF